MDPCEADLAGASQACAPYPAREGAVTAGTARILRPKRLWGFALPSRLTGLILRLGSNGERQPGGAFRGAYALGSRVAASTILGRRLHLDTPDSSEVSMAGAQPVLVVPAGQIACCRSQSIWKCWASKPAPSRACQ